MGVIDGHLPYLFRLKRSGMVYLKIKDIFFSIRYRDAKPYKTTENNRPESLRYCIVVLFTTRITKMLSAASDEKGRCCARIDVIP